MKTLTHRIRNWWTPEPKDTGIVPVLLNEIEAAPVPRAEEAKALQTGLIQNILALERKSAQVRDVVAGMALAEMSGVTK